MSGRTWWCTAPAIFQDNCELTYAREHNIPTVERSVMLGAISDSFENAICISGTHGKTTTTSLLTSILIDCGQDPSAVIGGKTAQNRWLRLRWGTGPVCL